MKKIMVAVAVIAALGMVAVTAWAQKELLSSDITDYSVSRDTGAFASAANGLCFSRCVASGKNAGGVPCVTWCSGSLQEETAEEPGFLHDIVITGKFKSPYDWTVIGAAELGMGFPPFICNPAQAELSEACPRIVANVTSKCESKWCFFARQKTIQVDRCIWAYSKEKPDEFMCKISYSDLHRKEGTDFCHVHNVVSVVPRDPLVDLGFKVSFGGLKGYIEETPVFDLLDIPGAATLCPQGEKKEIQMQKMNPDILKQNAPQKQ